MVLGGISPDATFIEAFPQWLETRVRLSPQTVTDYRRYAKQAGKFFGSVKLKDIHIGMLLQYQKERGSKVVPIIVNKELGTVLQVRRRAFIQDNLEDMYEPLPLPHWQPPKTITDQQEQRFLEVLRGRPDWEVVYLYALLSLRTGATGAEIRGLRLGDFDMHGKFMFIRRDFVKNKYRIRKIPLVNAAMWAAERLMQIAHGKGSREPHHYVLPFRWASDRYDPCRPCTRSMIRKPWDAARKLAGIPDFVPHNARHQVNTKLYETGADDMTVMSLMGHQSKQMSEHYSWIRDQRKRQAVENALENALDPPRKFGPQSASR